MAKIIACPGYCEGDAILFIGSNKSALIDTGMEYCSDDLVAFVKKQLGDRPLDYILLTHSHYDHVCGVPALRKAWPDVIVGAHPHAKKILAKDKVNAYMQMMSKGVYEEMDPDHEVRRYPTSAYEVNLELTEGMKIDLGDFCFTVIETPGHTKCSISFYEEKEQLIYASESTGISTSQNPTAVEPCYLTSYTSSMKSIEKLKKLPVKKVLQSHRSADSITNPETYFHRAEYSFKLSADFVLSLYKKGIPLETILEIYTEIYAKRMDGQPDHAFMANATASIPALIREYEAGLLS